MSGNKILEVKSAETEILKRTTDDQKKQGCDVGGTTISYTLYFLHVVVGIFFLSGKSQTILKTDLFGNHVRSERNTELQITRPKKKKGKQNKEKTRLKYFLDIYNLKLNIDSDETGQKMNKQTTLKCTNFQRTRSREHMFLF